MAVVDWQFDSGDKVQIVVEHLRGKRNTEKRNEKRCKNKRKLEL
jgi:hypothetical protein